MVREPAVNLAIQHWRDHQRLPPPCSVEKLKRYMRSS